MLRQVRASDSSGINVEPIGMIDLGEAWFDILFSKFLLHMLSRLVY